MLKIFTDNQGAVSIVNKGSMKAELQELSLKIQEKAKIKSLTVKAWWIPRELNVEADEMSRDRSR